MLIRLESKITKKMEIFLLHKCSSWIFTQLRCSIFKQIDSYSLQPGQVIVKMRAVIISYIACCYEWVGRATFFPIYFLKEILKVKLQIYR